MESYGVALRCVNRSGFATFSPDEALAQKRLHTASHARRRRHAFNSDAGGAIERSRAAPRLNAPRRSAATRGGAGEVSCQAQPGQRHHATRCAGRRPRLQAAGFLYATQSTSTLQSITMLDTTQARAGG